MRRVAALLMMAVLSFAARAPAEPAGPEPFREDWFQKDLELMAPLRDPDFSSGLTKTELLHRLEDFEERSGSGPTGFGGARLRLHGYGGYMSASIGITTFEDRVIGIRILFGTSPPPESELTDRYRAALGPQFEAKIESGGLTLEYEWTDLEGFARYQQTVHAQLGEPPAAQLPEDLRVDFELLTSPFQWLDVGLDADERCYLGGEEPRGSVAVGKLAARGRVDLLRRVLRGVNPEGRVYAARALLALANPATPLSDSDRAAIEKLRALEVPVATCQGCDVWRTTAAELLPPPPSPAAPAR